MRPKLAFVFFLAPAHVKIHFVFTLGWRCPETCTLFFYSAIFSLVSCSWVLAKKTIRLEMAAFFFCSSILLRGRIGLTGALKLHACRRSGMQTATWKTQRLAWPWYSTAVAPQCLPGRTSETWRARARHGRWGRTPCRKKQPELAPEGTQNSTKNTTIFPHNFFRLDSLLKNCGEKSWRFLWRFAAFLYAFLKLQAVPSFAEPPCWPLKDSNTANVRLLWPGTSG